MSGARARVPASDERKDDWLTPTQWRSEQRRLEKERDKAIKAGLDVVAAAPQLVAAVPTVARAAGERVRAGVSAVRAARLGVGVGGAAVGVGTAAALAILAGAASYFGTRWLIERFGTRLSKTDRAYRAAEAYREARRDAEKKLGRPLTPDEHAYLARDFKAKLKSIGWG